jgi:hypothetical protein
VRVGAVSSPSFNRAQLAELARRPQLTVTFADGELVRVVRVTKPSPIREGFFGAPFVYRREHALCSVCCAISNGHRVQSDLFGLSSKAELSIFDFDGDMLLHPVLFDTCADR